MAYPIPENVTGIYELGLYTNSVTDGIMGYGFLIVLFAVMFLRFHGFRETQAALVGAAFFTFFVATTFRVIGWINDYAFYISVIVLIGSILWYKLSE